MSYVEINIPAMQAMIDALRVAIREMPDAAAGLRRRLDYVWLSAPGLAAWTPGGSAEAELIDIWRDSQNRLDKAITVSRMGAGFGASAGPGAAGPAASVVGFEDNPDVTLADAQTAADLMDQLAGLDAAGADAATVADLAGKLQALLAAGATDTAFGLKLSQLVDPGKLLDALNRVDVVWGGPPGSHEDPDAAVEHASLLDSLGQTFSTAINAMAPGSQTRDTFIQSWRDVFTHAAPGSVSPSLASLVVGHGDWPDDFLTGVADSILDAEHGGGIGRWALLFVMPDGTPRQVVDPSMPSAPDGTVLSIGDPLYGVLMASALHGPGWFAAWCGDGQVEVSWDQGGAGDDPGKLKEQMSGLANARIHDLFENRGLDPASFVALSLAASAADAASAPSSLPDDWRPQLSDSVWRAAAAQVRDAELFEAKPWWDKYGHQILALGAMLFAALTAWLPSGVPTMVAAGAMIGVTVADAAWYFADGDIADGLLDVGMLVLPIVIGGTIRLLPVARSALTRLLAGEVGAVDGGVVGFKDGTLALVDAPRYQAVFGKKVKVTPFDVEPKGAALNTRATEAAIHDADKAARDQIISDLDDMGFPLSKEDLAGLGSKDTIDETIQKLQRRFSSDDPTVMAAVDEKLTALAKWSHAERGSITPLNQASKYVGHAGGYDSFNGRGVELVTEGSGPSCFDLTGLDRADHEYIVAEVKGGDAELGKGIKVDDPAAPGGMAAQGSTEYFNRIWAQDQGVQEALKTEIVEPGKTLGEALREGTYHVRYELIKTRATGYSTVTDLVLDPKYLHLTYPS